MKPLAIETSWPLPVLWPNSREHRMRTYSARKSAKDEGFWSNFARFSRSAGNMRAAGSS